jgi:hypothetical protein
MVWIVVRNILGAVESASPSPRCWECFGTIDCLPNLKINRVDLSSITCSNRSLCPDAHRSVTERDCLQTNRSSRELIAGEGHLSLSPPRTQVQYSRLHRRTFARTRLAPIRSAVRVSALLTKKFAVYRYAYRRTHTVQDDDEVQVDLRARKSRIPFHNQ